MHSEGGATHAFKSHVPETLIQLHGDWKSQAFRKYITLSFEDKLVVAEQMKMHILEAES